MGTRIGGQPWPVGEDVAPHVGDRCQTGCRAMGVDSCGPEVVPAFRVLALYVGFARLNHLRFLEREPMLTGILKVLRLPPQSTFWRFLASLHLSVAGQILKMQRVLRQRVWEAAHVQLKVVTMDTDTTVHTVFGKQMGGRKSYNPKNRGKKSFQPILTFLAETREYVSGEIPS
jgi:hypothetical protein